MSLAPTFDWAYIPPGTSLRLPLASPFHASRAHLPRSIFVVGAELDFLADEAHQFALRAAGRGEADPRYGEVPGRAEASAGPAGELELDDPRFAWEEAGVRWLLVPDVVHAFDLHVGEAMGGEGSVEDARAKTEAYMRLVGEWLFAKAWA